MFTALIRLPNSTVTRRVNGMGNIIPLLNAGGVILADPMNRLPEGYGPAKEDPQEVTTEAPLTKKKSRPRKAKYRAHG